MDALLTIPDDAWRDVKDTGFTAPRLKAVVAPAMHADAIAVYTRHDGVQQAVDPVDEADLTELYQLVRPQGPFVTVTITGPGCGLDYVVYLTPFEQ